MSGIKLLILFKSTHKPLIFINYIHFLRKLHKLKMISKFVFIITEKKSYLFLIIRKVF